MNNTSVPIRITHHGAPIVGSAILHREGPRVVAIALDLTNKYCRVACLSNGMYPGVTIEVREESLHLDETKHRDDYTKVEFPSYAGWRVWSAWSGRYTIALCLVKPDDPSKEG